MHFGDRAFFTPERKRWIAPSIYLANELMLRLNSLNFTRQQSCLVGLGRWRIESLTAQFDDLTPRWAIRPVPSPIESPQ
jgi:hypothetical protein